MRLPIIISILAAVSSAASAAAQTPANTAHSRDELLAAARSIVETARFTTFVTIGEDGAPRARIVDPFAPDSLFEIWIATNPATRKVADIKRDARVVMLWFEPGNPGYVSLSGKASVVTDQREKEKRWKEDWKGLYSDRNHGPDYMLIRVKPLHMEVVSYARGIMNEPRSWRPPMIDFEDSKRSP